MAAQDGISRDPVVRFKDLLLNDHMCYQIFGVMRLSALRALPPQGSYVHSDGVLLAQMGLIGRFHETPEFLFISTRHQKQSSVAKPVRIKAPRFRLTNRHGTLPGPGVVGSKQDHQHHVPGMAHVSIEFFQCIRRAPVATGQRLHCYLLLLPWLVKHFRRMGKDLLIAADQVLFRLADAARESLYGERNIAGCCLVTNIPPK